MTRRLSSAFFSLTIILAPLASAAKNYETYYNWHLKALDGDLADIDAQIVQFTERLHADPNDHLARAYLGSSYALRARESTWPPTRLKYLKLGRKTIDQAVAAAPANPRIRLIRAIAYYRVPLRFKVRHTSLNDFEILIPIAQAPDSPLDLNERQALLYYAFLAHQEANLPTAAALKNACHRLDPSSTLGKATR